ncbi:peptide chain release factor N(5)-glutamine methyltransferase [Mesoterricola silvestris]|uniref:peptide chain release factor N(5)-glutamine methyltransferase n=1 Tax=Mesoterricola silvestris TaxID=2927979 RepID=A0AA48K8W1_9BACT|nr:peptide chain release factor N(5)-glutamine methyltransferase [Mesoterricola silvestris]BDU73354.1 release factor glutamine methyltransferase [Mesoterricola silvestris]
MPLTYAQFAGDLASALSGFLDRAEARAESRRWLQEGLDLSPSWLLAHGDDPVPDGDRARVAQWLERRRQGEPWSYILGWCAFRGRRFSVTRDTLIPRPETELVLEAALEVGRRLGVLHACDVGTGSGILAVCMALETDWEIQASDISPGALKAARANAAALGAKVAFRRGHLLAPLKEPLGLVVSNPPYVDPADAPGLQRELAFEPATALFAPDRGLALSAEILREARRRAAPGCVLEIGAGQGEELKARALASGWKRAVVHQDLAGHDRCLMALL